MARSGFLAGLTQRFSALSDERKLRFASLMSVSVAATLVLMKLATLIATSSSSVLASLTDSGLDLLASLITFFAVRFARTPPDEEHPFGHGKAEAFSALFQAGLVFASAALVVQDALKRFAEPEPVHNPGLAVGVLIAAAALTLALLFVQSMALASTRSVAIKADRMHYLGDLLSQVIGLIGVGAAALGFLFMDALGGILIALWLVWGAVGVLREAADHLMDKGLPAEEQAEIVTIVTSDQRVRGVHELRTRETGPWVLIQMHVELEPSLSLREAHQIIITAEKNLLERFPNADILIHPDPKGEAEPHGGVFAENRGGRGTGTQT